MSLERKMRSLEKMNFIKLCSLCKVAQLDELKDKEKYLPTVIAFELDEDIIQTIPYILECSQGVLFTKLWDKQGREMAKQKGEPLEVEEILEQVWRPTHQFYKDLCGRLKSGDMKFSEFEKYFKTTDLGTLRNELNRLSVPEDRTWVDVRLSQLEKYRNLRRCLFGAEIIMEVVKEFQLEGNFNQIIEILKLVRF